MTIKEEIQDEALRTTYLLALARGIEKGKAEERERILEAVKLTLQLYPHKQRDELYSEIIGYLNRIDKSKIAGEKENQK